MDVVASLSQGRKAAAQCGLFTYKSVPVIFEPPCISHMPSTPHMFRMLIVCRRENNSKYHYHRSFTKVEFFVLN